MNALVKKEIRLLLPSWLVGLAAVGLGIFWTDPQHPDAWFRGYGLFAFPFVLGPAMVLLMALRSFGYELSAGTFSLLLAQPVARRRLWRTKTALLALGIASVCAAWCLMLFYHQLLHQSTLLSADEFHTLIVTALLFSLAVYSGGLSWVLLLRQVGAAFWFALIVPAALALLTSYASETFGDGLHTERNLILVLVAYSVGSFCWARRMFLRAQDVQWTGGEIALPAWIKLPRGLAAPQTLPSRRPRRALFAKELQLHQAQFIIAGALLALHLGMLTARNWADDFKHSPTLEFVGTAFWVLWLVMPLLIGCVAVAEERKLGTLEAQLCLPIRRRTQLTIKFGVAFMLSVCLGVVMPLLLEGNRIFPHFLPRTVSNTLELPATFLLFCLIVLSILSIAFYCSTLVRNTLQALAPAIAGTLLTWVLLLSAPAIDEILDYPLWHGWLIYLIGLPVLAATLTRLAFWNFKHVLVGWSVWRRNLVVVLSVLVAVMAVTSATYQRAWELVERLEPPPGPARLRTSDVVSLTDLGLRPAIQFTDGRSWSGRLYLQDASWLTRLLNRWTLKAVPGDGFLAGTDWASVAYSSRDVVGLQRDGSLWVSEKPRSLDHWPIGLPTNRGAIKLVRLGNESDWKNVVGNGASVFLLKQDGTLWRLGPLLVNYFTTNWTGLRTFAPERLGNTADWAEIFASDGRTVFRKTDGRTYVYPGAVIGAFTDIKLEEGLILTRSPVLEQKRWRNLVGAWYSPRGLDQLGLAADGTLRVVSVSQRVRNRQSELVVHDVQLGTETNWVAMVQAQGYTPRANVSIVTLKSDGSLWTWAFRDNPLAHPERAQARRLSGNSNWIAISAAPEGVLSLAADGGLWLWRFADTRDDGEIPPLTRPSRKPQLLGNIFDAAK